MVLALGGCATKNTSRSIEDIIKKDDVIEYIHIKDNIYACFYKTTDDNENIPDVIFVTKTEDNKWETLNDSDWTHYKENAVDVYFDKYFWDEENSNGVYIAYGKIHNSEKIIKDGVTKDVIIDTFEITLNNEEKKNAVIIHKYGEQYFYCIFMAEGKDFFEGRNFKVVGKYENWEAFMLESQSILR